MGQKGPPFSLETEVQFAQNPMAKGEESSQDLGSKIIFLGKRDKEVKQDKLLFLLGISYRSSPQKSKCLASLT